MHSADFARGKFEIDFLIGTMVFPPSSDILTSLFSVPPPPPTLLHLPPFLSLPPSLFHSSLQYRARDAASRGDKYMLVSFDEPSMAVKVGRHFPLFPCIKQNFEVLYPFFSVRVDGEPHYFYIGTKESSGL